MGPMKNPRALLTAGLAAIAALFTAACDDTTPVTLTVFHINDLHISLRHHASQPHDLGGVARLKTLLDARRAATAGQPSLFLDAGDWSEGNIFYSLDSGASALRVLQLLGVDATVLGNHDFIAGPDTLLDALRAVPERPPVLAANLNYNDYPRTAELQAQLPPYQVFRFGSLAVGVIGVTTFEITYASYMQPIVITDPVPAVSYLTQAMRSQGVQAIILLSHNSYAYNKALARMVPWVTAVVSGHSHVKKPRGETVMNAGRLVPVVETGQWGQFLGELKLEIRPSDGTTTVKGVHLHPVSADLPEDPVLSGEVSRLERAVSDRFGYDVFSDTVAVAEDAFPHHESRESALSNFLTDAYRRAAGADMAFDVASLLGMGLGAGPITTADVFNLMPHIYNQATGKTWTVKRLTLTGREIENVLNLWFGVGSFDLPITGSLSVSGIEADYAADGGLTPIRRLDVGGIPINPAQDYTIAVHDGFLLILTLANDLIHLGLNLSRIEDTGIEGWRAALDLLRERGTLRAEDTTVGLRTRLLAPDLFVDTFNVRAVKEGPGHWRITARVRNVGLQDVPAGATATFRFGTLGDAVNDDTRWETLRTPAGAVVTLSAIPAGTSNLVTWNWTGAPQGRGQIPLVVELNSPSDTNVTNNSARIHVEN